jgi:hypothetical protein
LLSRVLLALPDDRATYSFLSVLIDRVKGILMTREYRRNAPAWALQPTGTTFNWTAFRAPLGWYQSVCRQKWRTGGDPSWYHDAKVVNCVKERITSKELAKLMGVSSATISRAFSTTARISEDTRVRVLAMAEKYGYQPNAIARTLNNRQSRLVAVVVNAIGN